MTILLTLAPKKVQLQVEHSSVAAHDQLRVSAVPHLNSLTALSFLTLSLSHTHLLFFHMHAHTFTSSHTVTRTPRCVPSN